MKEPPKTGEKAREFNLPDSTGTKKTLAELVSSGPVMFVFFRGMW